MTFTGQVPGPELDPAGACVDRDGRIVERQPDIRQTRLPRAPARQSFDQRGQIITEEADHSPLKRGQRRVGQIGGVPQPEPPQNAGQDRKNISFAAFNRSRVGVRRPARAGCFPYHTRIGGQNAPAAGIAKARPALEERQAGATCRSQPPEAPRADREPDAPLSSSMESTFGLRRSQVGARRSPAFQASGCGPSTRDAKRATISLIRRSLTRDRCRRGGTAKAPAENPHLPLSGPAASA